MSLCTIVLLAPTYFGFSAGTESGLPWLVQPDGWRTDPAWYDGKAEKCTYEATYRIYGMDRSFEAYAYTNKQVMDERTTTKAAGAGGVEVFKHHWSERVPTENYDYDFSTATFTRTDDLTPFKLTAATQEDCGASFKQMWREGDDFSWFSSVYFPGAGMERGKFPSAGVFFQDALGVVLRDFPFETTRPGHTKKLLLVPSQRHTRQTSSLPRSCSLTYEGREMLSLPVGSVEAHRLSLSEAGGRQVATYWFAADGEAPWLHALVQFQAAKKTLIYRLRTIERTAYWER